MNITENTIDILKSLSGHENISITDELKKDLTMDSFSMVLLLVEIEDEFNIELDESDMNPFDLITVKDVIDLVEKYGVQNNEKIS